MDKKIIFFDIDGTIYHNTIGVVEDAAIGIRKLREQGHKVFLCTGRSRAGIDDDIVGVGFDGIVAACGTYIEIDGKTIKNQILSDEVIKNVVDNLCYIDGVYVIMDGSSNIYIGKHPAPIEERKKFDRFIEMNKSRIKTFEDKIVDVNKFCIRLETNIDYKTLIPIIAKDFDVIVHNKYTLEAVPHGYDKGTGIKEIATHYGVELKDTIAFGDGNNDIPMFEVAGFSVVVGDENPIAVKKADYMTSSVLEGGVGKALKELGLIC